MENFSFTLSLKTYIQYTSNLYILQVPFGILIKFSLPFLCIIPKMGPSHLPLLQNGDLLCRQRPKRSLGKVAQSQAALALSL